jgi:hypothetical protein
VKRLTRPGAWLWRLLHRPTNAGRLRGDGNGQERAGSERLWQRHHGPGEVHRRIVQNCRVRGELIPHLTDDCQPPPDVATELGWWPLRARSARRRRPAGARQGPARRRRRGRAEPRCGFSSFGSSWSLRGVRPQGRPTGPTPPIPELRRIVAAAFLGWMPDLRGVHFIDLARPTSLHGQPTKPI